MNVVYGGVSERVNLCVVFDLFKPPVWCFLGAAVKPFDLAWLFLLKIIFLRSEVFLLTHSLQMGWSGEAQRSRALNNKNVGQVDYIAFECTL